MLGIDYVSSDEEDVVSVVKPEVSSGDMSRKDAIATNIELSKPSLQAAAPPVAKPVQAPAPLASEKAATPTALPEGPSQGRKLSLAACRARNMF